MSYNKPFEMEGNMAEIIRIPEINKMSILACPICDETKMEFYSNYEKIEKDEELCLAFKCLSCEHIGYSYFS